MTQPSDPARPAGGPFEGTAAFGGDVEMQGEFVAGRDINIANLQRVLPAPPPAPVGWLQLPPDAGDFTGRTAEIDELRKLLEQSRTQSPTATPVLLVNGMPGVGKSALALHLAHLLKDAYPDAQLYARLGGVGEPTVTVADVLDRLLRALGVKPEQLPAAFQERVDVYRTLMAGRRGLVLLDNVLDREQVQPLCPASEGCLVLVTSRSDLPGMDGVTAYRLQPMPIREGVELLGRLVGVERVADHAAAERVVTLCGGLPLAIRLAGASLATTATRRLPLDRLVDRLVDARGRLDALADEADERRAVRASFQLSYEQLPGELARVFRWLSLLQVPDVAAEVVAALVDAQLEDAQRWLRALVNGQLVEPTGPTGERYRLHDLLALYADRLAQQDLVEERQGAVKRVLAWYLDQTEQTSGLLNIRRAEVEQLIQVVSQPADRIRADPAALQVALVLMALGWFEAERASLVAIQRQAAELGQQELVWRLAARLVRFFDRRKHWGDWETTHVRALAAARQLGDAAAEGLTLSNLGICYAQQRRFAEAVGYFQQSLAIRRELGDRHGEGQALGNLGNVYFEQRRFAEAVDSYQHSLMTFRELGDRHGEGNALGSLGNAYFGQRRFAEAIGSYQQSLMIRRELGDRYGEGLTQCNLGMVYAEQGARDYAEECFTQALAIFQELEAPKAEGVAATLAELRRPRGPRALLAFWRRR